MSLIMKTQKWSIRTVSNALAAVFLVLCVGCVPGPVRQPAAGTAQPPTTAPQLPTEANTETPASTSLPPPTVTETPPALPPAPEPEPQVCTPIEGLAIADLPDHLTNPFFLPPPGSDQPHQGIDLADFLTGTRIGISGRTVQAVLAGTVQTVLVDAFPYGFAVMIETPLSALSAWPDLAIPGPRPPEELPWNTTLTCPNWPPTPPAETRRSLYLLYAHLDAAPVVAVGEQAACGTPIGAIGDSGNALNPHLHLEVRVGPSDADFTGMRHYDPGADAAQMAAYCLWRVSGWYQAVDPVIVLEAVK